MIYCGVYSAKNLYKGLGLNLLVIGLKMNSCEDIKIQYSKTQDSICMSKERIANLILIDVMIGPVSIPFVFDTGATMTLMSKTVAEEIGATETEKTLEAGGSAGKQIELKTAVIDCMQIGQARIFNKEVAVVPDHALDFGVDDDGNQLCVKGFLGWDIIQHFKWTINTQLRTITIEKPALNKGDENLFWDGFLMLAVNYNGEEMHLGFDTGHTESMLGQRMIEKLNCKNQRVDLTTGVDGTVEEEVYNAERFEFSIGGTPIYLEDVCVLKREIFGAKDNQMLGLLGVDIIQNKVMEIDYFNRHFTLR